MCCTPAGKTLVVGESWGANIVNVTINADPTITEDLLAPLDLLMAYYEAIEVK